MSSSACIAYFGLRFEVSEGEIDALEARSDFRQVAARREGLSSYWNNFGGDSDRYILFVGKKIAALGPEDGSASSTSATDFSNLMSDTIDRLGRAELAGTPSLHLEWHHDV